MHVIYTGAHGGFDTSRIPLGGGAAVMDALVREWSRTRPFELTVLGVGDRYDLPDFRYVRMPVSLDKSLTDLGEMEYARFCRQFERATTEWIKANCRSESLSRFPPHLGPLPRSGGEEMASQAAAENISPLPLRERPGEGDAVLLPFACQRQPPTLILCNDISEGPDFRQLAFLDIPIATIFHVDVVEYVARIYCHGRLEPERLAQLHRGVEKLRLARFFPDVLRLIFEKQADCVRHSTKLILPSRGMADVLRRCYPGCDSKLEVIPWGAIEEGVRSREPGARSIDLGKEFGIEDDETVLLTLCRISPEKGIDRLLEALIEYERTGARLCARTMPALRLFICGAPAYMQGREYMARLQRLARQLKTVRVHFVGHVSGDRKQAFFALADLYVHLSYHESYGLTISEAMRAGCPVLTTEHHSAPDLVPPACGRIVSGRTDETVAALRELLADRPRLKAMGKAAMEHGRELDFSAAAARLAGVLKQACASQRF